MRLKIYLKYILFLLCVIYIGSAAAADITLGVIGPHEYDLPVDFKSFNVFVQYGDGNIGGSYYNSQGSRHSGGGGHTWAGMSKYVHFWTFDAIPHVGFAYEIIQSESYTLANGKNFGGLGPTISGPAIWFKPNAHSTFGLQTFLETPRGTRDALSPNYWANLSSFMFDYEWKHFSFDGDLGGVFSSTKHVTGQHSYHPGPVFHSNLRFGWKLLSSLEPFFAFDWQSVSSLYDNTLHQHVAQSKSNEVSLGAGAMWSVTRSLALTGHYSHAVTGRNAVGTNAYYLKMTYLW